MAIRVTCPNPDCGATARIEEQSLGRRGRCKTCGQVFELARPDGQPASLSSGDASAWKGSDPASPTDLPEQFGRYRIRKKLGQGGMGAVYLAHDTRLDRPVALKVPFFHPLDGPQAIARFEREARAAATLDHPNLCPIYDVGEIGGVAYLTMPYVEGKTLADALTTGQTFTEVQAAAVVRKLAQALQEAHARGVVHRDLKPANIMIKKGRDLVIMDFGLARMAGGEDGGLTRTGHVLGTALYMAPEQAAGDLAAIGPAVDVYALGVILHELLTGQRPFEGPWSLVIGLKNVKDPDPPSRHRPGLSPAIDAVCLKAIAQKPEDRYATMADFAGALGALLATPTTSASGTASPAESRESLAARVFSGIKTGAGRYSREQEPHSRPEPARPGGKPPRLPSRAGIAAAAGAVALILGVIIYVATAKGRIKIEVHDPDAVVIVDGQVVRVEGLGEPITLRAGEHDLSIKRGEVEVEARKFVVRRGDNPALSIDLLVGRAAVEEKARVEPKAPVEETGPVAPGAPPKVESVPERTPVTPERAVASRFARFPAPRSEWVGKVQQYLNGKENSKGVIRILFTSREGSGFVAEYRVHGKNKLEFRGTIDDRGMIKVDRVAKITNDWVDAFVKNMVVFGMIAEKTITLRYSSNPGGYSGEMIAELVGGGPPDPSAVVENRLGMKWKLIPAGDFAMGRDDGELHVRPRHKVRITRPFYLGATEVTVEQFRRFVEEAGYKPEAERPGSGGGTGWDEAKGEFDKGPKFTRKSPGFPQGDDHPVVDVSWNDASAFCDWLGREDGQTYRLPTEAEWEYACRAGTSTTYWTGDDVESLAGAANVPDAAAKAKFPAWGTIRGDDGHVFTAPVGRFRPNAFGLFDMHGNVAEWCADWYSANYYARSPASDPVNSIRAEDRVPRGGSFMEDAQDTGAAVRARLHPAEARCDVGFRVVRVQPASDEGRGSRASPIADRLRVGTSWIGRRTYPKAHYQGSTVTYELHVDERDGKDFRGHVFDNGRNRNRMEVQGEVAGGVISWREKFPNGLATWDVRGTLSGGLIDASLVSFQGRALDDQGKASLTLNE